MIPDTVEKLRKLTRTYREKCERGKIDPGLEIFARTEPTRVLSE
jgi:hypothetical protein